MSGEQPTDIHGPLAGQMSLPKIRDSLIAHYSSISLMEIDKNGKPQWSQDAVDFGCLLNFTRTPASGTQGITVLRETAYEQADAKIRSRYEDEDDLRLALAVLACFNSELKALEPQ